MLKLEPISEKEIKDVVKYANAPEILDNLSDEFPSPYTEADYLNLLKEVSSKEKMHVFAIH